MPDMKTLTMNGTAYTIMDETARNHIANTDNPHGVTATQVGARPDTWMPTAAEVGARSDTWLPTISEIGAAPSGYGLGSGYGRWCTDCNDATENGFYSLSGSSVANGPDGNSKYGNMLVLARNAGSPISQIVFYNGYVQIRTYINSVWSAWEYINPPMTLGVEYRTTERHEGKVVYTKLVNLGTLPARNSTTHVSTGVSATAVLRIAAHTAGGTPIPYGYSNTLTKLIDIGCTTATIHVWTADSEHAESYSSSTGVVQLWYTKD